MTTDISGTAILPTILCFASAVFYVAATVMMKLWGHAPFALVVIPIAAAFAAAAWFEVSVLRGGRLGPAFLMILAFEVAMTGLFSIVVLRERYGGQELAGLAIIAAGVAVLSHAGLGQAAATGHPAAALHLHTGGNAPTILTDTTPQSFNERS